jgi:hypothetical protein
MFESGGGAVEIFGRPVLTSEAVAASSAQSGPATVVSMTTGGIIINLLFDAAAMAAPASFRACIQQAASISTGAILDHITVNIKIDYSGTGGGASGGPDNGLYQSYSSVRANLISHATPRRYDFQCVVQWVLDPGAIQCRCLECTIEALGGDRGERHQH